MSGTIPIYTTDKIPWKSEKHNTDITLYIRPLDTYVRAKLEDEMAVLKSGVKQEDIENATEDEVKDFMDIRAGVGSWWLIRFALAGWDWEHEGKPVDFGKLERIPKWGRSYYVASEKSIDLLRRSAPELYLEVKAVIMTEGYLQEQEAKNSSSPSPAPFTDSIVQPA